MIDTGETRFWDPYDSMTDADFHAYVEELRMHGQAPKATDQTEPSFADYEGAIVTRRREHPEWRDGEAAFNVLARLRPDIAYPIVDTSVDPFYEDARLGPFLAHVRERWESMDLTSG